MLKNAKSLVLVIAVLGLISALATGYVKSGYGRDSSVMDALVENSPSRLGGYKPTLPKSANNGEINKMMAEAPASITAQDTAFAPMPDGYGYDALEVKDRVYQKSATFQLVVKDVDNYLRQIKEYTLSVEGRILWANQYSSQSPKYKIGNLLIKLPVSKFEEGTTRAVTNVSKVFSEQISANDATGQYVSTQDQVNQLKEQRSEKEIQLLKANNEVEKKQIELDIQRLNNRIASAEKQAQSVENQVEYATINISVTDNEDYFQGQAFSKPDFSYQLRQAWYSVLRWLIIIVVVVIWAAVYSVLWLPLVLLAWFLIKIKRKKTTDG
ncbi:MAG: DUF4349 domain-containing protein [Patescibacteria group bacterium]